MAEPARAGLISVVGGESTGKSTPGRRTRGTAAGDHRLRRSSNWVDRHGRVPRATEQAAVMDAHRRAERSALLRADQTGQPWVISDSGPLMTAVYSIQYYEDDSLLPLALEWTAQSDRVVWCQDDFPWQPDPQRDGPLARTGSQQILAAIFADHPGLPVLAVHGPLNARIDTVLAAVSYRV